MKKQKARRASSVAAKHRPTAPAIGPSARQRAMSLARQFKLPEAIAILRTALLAAEQTVDAAPADVASVLVDLAQFRAATGDLPAATADALRAVSLLRPMGASQNAALGFALLTLARLEFAAPADAAPNTLREALQLLTDAHGADHAITQQALQIARLSGVVDAAPSP
ncbi:MAG: hypothetical protein JWM10_807 [Myxococcaceae bacterium]|nr:hypothetical protein [Myxococcaceae bacterium]